MRRIGNAVGGQGGADSLCRELAAAAGLPLADQYRAWLGGPFTPIDRIDPVPGWLSTCDGGELGVGTPSTLHAADPTRLCDEHGDPPHGVVDAPGVGRGHWSGAEVDGSATSGGTCGGWIGGRTGRAGSIDAPGPDWISLMSLPCDELALSLICVGQIS